MTRSLENRPKCKSDQHLFFGSWGVLWRILEAVSGGFWELCWKMLAPILCFFGYLGRCCGILVPRWRTGGRGKIGELRRRGLLQGGSNPCGRTRRTPLHPPKNGFSRMGLQTPTAAGTGSGKLEDWKTGGLEDWVIGYWGLRLYIVHATVPSSTVADIIIILAVYFSKS